MKRERMANYSTDEVTQMVHSYENSPSRETVEVLAKTLNKSIKSVIGKLSREGVYQKTTYVSKTGEKPITKESLVRCVETQLNVPENSLSGLEKSPKGVLKDLCELTK